MRADAVIVCAGELSVAVGIKSYLLHQGKTLLFVQEVFTKEGDSWASSWIIESSLCWFFCVDLLCSLAKGKALTFIFLLQHYGITRHFFPL